MGSLTVTGVSLMCRATSKDGMQNPLGPPMRRGDLGFAHVT